MRENRLSGLMRGGKQTVIGSGLSIRRFLPTLHNLRCAKWKWFQIAVKICPLTPNP